MKHSRTLWGALAVAVLGAPPAAAQGWGEVALRPQPGGIAATCLRETGASDRISLIGPRSGGAFSTQVLSAGPAGLADDTRIVLGGPVDCLEVGIAPQGGAVAAGLVSARRADTLVASVRPPGGIFGTPTVLHRTRLLPVKTAVAAGDQAVVVAWVEARRTNGRPFQSRVRIVAARGSAAGGVGPPEALTPWHRVGVYTAIELDASVDGAGRVTVAWTRPVRGRFPDFGPGRVEEASAAPGGPFSRPHTVTRLADFFAVGLALEGAADGRSLLVATTSSLVDVLEREPGAARFRRRARFVSAGSAAPVVALRNGGGAVIAWRTSNEFPIPPNAGVVVTRRERAGRFTRPEGAVRTTDFAFSEAVTVFGRLDSRRPPADTGNTRLRAALADNGQALLTWIAPRPARQGDRPLAPTVASGSLAGGFGKPRQLGSRCRAANAAAPLMGAGGPLVAWTDNVSHAYAGLLGEEIARNAGRLHLAAADRAPSAGAAAPGLRMAVPRGQRLRPGRPLRVRAHCDGACDVRATARRERGGRVTAVGSGRLGRRGTLTLLLRPDPFRPRVVNPDGSVIVTARACAPGGTDSNVVTRTARVTALPPRRHRPRIGPG